MVEIVTELSRCCNSVSLEGSRRRIHSDLTQKAVASARKLAEGSRVLEKDVLISACAILFFRYTNVSTLRFGEQSSGAPLLSHALEVTATTSFEDLLDRLRQRETVCAAIGSATPVIRYVANSGNASQDPSSLAAVSEDLRIDFLSSGQSISVYLSYRQDKVPDVIVDHFAGHLSCLLESLADRPAAGIGEIPYLPATELRQILAHGQGPVRDYDLLPVAEMIARQAERQPDAMALEDECSKLTYGELLSRSARIAYGLAARKLPPRARVAVLMNRSADWIATILGILRAGMVYVPLSARNPLARNDHIISDCSVQLVIANAENQQQFACTTITAADLFEYAEEEAPRLPSIHGDDDAYIIYTSGSTGAPKGVRITHAALANYIQAATEAFGLDVDPLRSVQFAEASFDASMLEIFHAICHGGSTFIYSHSGALSVSDFAAMIESRAITMASPPTALWHEWMDQTAVHRSSIPACLKVAIVGGEAALPRTFHPPELPPGLRLYNAYGPTEATVDAACYRCADEVWNVRYVPIGRPLPNVRLYVLDDRLMPVAAGVVGELCIGGAGVSPGYVGRDDLNAGHFVEIAIDDSRLPERIYRTGDLAFLQQDGTFVCLGRRDSQVKISGMRADLGEIEMRLNAFEEVRQAIVTWDQDYSDKAGLAMYLQLASSVPKTAETLERIKAYLRHYLPAYMIPSHHLFVENFPLNANGKIDRKQLPQIGFPSTPAIDAGLSADPLEKELWDLWSKLVPRDALTSMDEDIFLKQASSLKLGLFFAEISVSWDVDLGDFTDARTISAIAAKLKKLLSPVTAESPLLPN